MATANDIVPTAPYDALADYERRSLAHIAGLPEQAEAEGLWRGIGFRVGSRHMVSSISEVNEILTMPALALVPGTQAWMLGVANVRGNLVAVIDLRGHVEGERSVLTDTSRVLVVRQHGGSVGLLVDEVLGQRSFSDEQRAQAFGEEDERYSRYVGEKVQLGDVLWGLFSMSALVRTAEFQQASV
ncbi:MAG: purine-binding chemotaxis protein CheW [Xanthomonadales bacterium]|nr:purine-binding chemotaxis protein CheW [Xanthomonadales bacterium]